MALFQAEQEIDAMTEVFNKIVSSCHTKCIPPKYSEGDLNKGESVCIDRCVAKYLETHQKVGVKISEMGQANLAAQQQIQQA